MDKMQTHPRRTHKEQKPTDKIIRTNEAKTTEGTAADFVMMKSRTFYLTCGELQPPAYAREYECLFVGDHSLTNLLTMSH